MPYRLGLFDDREEQEPRRFAEQNLEHGEEDGEGGECLVSVEWNTTGNAYGGVPTHYGHTGVMCRVELSECLQDDEEDTQRLTPKSYTLNPTKLEALNPKPMSHLKDGEEDREAGGQPPVVRR